MPSGMKGKCQGEAKCRFNIPEGGSCAVLAVQSWDGDRKGVGMGTRQFASPSEVLLPPCCMRRKGKASSAA